MLKTLYSNITLVLIFQYSYTFVEYSPLPWLWLSETNEIYCLQLFSAKSLRIWLKFCLSGYWLNGTCLIWVSRHFLQNHWGNGLNFATDVAWPLTELIRLWLLFADIFHYDAILTEFLVLLCWFYTSQWPFGWNRSYLGFLGIIWWKLGVCERGGRGIFPMLWVELCLVGEYNGFKLFQDSSDSDRYKFCIFWVLGPFKSNIFKHECKAGTHTNFMKTLKGPIIENSSQQHWDS